MRQKAPIFLLVLLFQLTVNGQASIDFLTAEKEAFVEVYWAMKAANIEIQADLAIPLETVDISSERYKELFEAAILSKEVQHSIEDQQLLTTISDRNDQLEIRSTVLLKEMCIAKNILIETYLSILHEYKTNLAFQRSLMPIFQSVMKSGL